ncbi:50S ribosomal protein L6 [candidate division KSB1 bacterium]|nr:50S ribosomal protein L6 [candidate division KSB1 bacterium]
MSRIGKLPIQIPDGVNVEIQGTTVSVSKGDKSLEQTIHPQIKISIDNEQQTLTLKRVSESKFHRSLHGLYRTLIHNMVVGVTAGFEKRLEIVGVGYRAEAKGRLVQFQLGYSHPVLFIPPEGVDVKVENPTTIIVSGFDKQLVGLIAAKIRSFRPPEPYKGKGIKYQNEYIRRKAGKTAGK